MDTRQSRSGRPVPETPRCSSTDGHLSRLVYSSTVLANNPASDSSHLTHNDRRFAFETRYLWTKFGILQDRNDLQLATAERRRGDFLELTDPAGTLQSCIDPDKPHRLIMENLKLLVSVLLFIPPPREILLFGTAAGSLLHFFRNHYPAQIVAVDIDEELISNAATGSFTRRRQSTGYRGEDALGSSTIAENVRPHPDRYFRGGRHPPWIRERQNLQRLVRLLSPHGAAAFNLLIDSDHEFSRFLPKSAIGLRQQTLSTPSKIWKTRSYSVFAAIAGARHRLVFGESAGFIP